MQRIMTLLVMLVFSTPVFADYTDLNNQAIRLFMKGNVAESIEVFNKVIQKNQKIAILHNNRGFIKSSSGDYFGALADFNTAIDLNNDDTAKMLSYFNRGNLKYAQEDYDGAIRDYTNALLLKPDFASAFRERAKAKQKSAEADMKKYTELTD